jgi:uncharacterized protein with HEPN domain
MPRRYEVYLRDVRDAAVKIREFTSGYEFDDFVQDEKTLLAVTRLFEIIGEAVGKIPEEVKASRPSVPWQGIKDFRNHLVHCYWDIDSAIMWDIIENELPALISAIDSMLME